MTSDQNGVRFSRQNEQDFLEFISDLDSNEKLCSAIKSKAEAGEISYSVSIRENFVYEKPAIVIDIADASNISQEEMDKISPSNMTLEEALRITT